MQCLRKSKPSGNRELGFLSSTMAIYSCKRLCIDFLGPLPKSTYGNVFRLVVFDAFTFSRGCGQRAKQPRT